MEPEKRGVQWRQRTKPVIVFPQQTGSKSLARKVKDELAGGESEVLAAETHHTARLDSVSAVRNELAKLYRLVRNGKLQSDEATRLTFVLKEIRAAVEAEPPLENSATIINTINIVSIPSGAQLDRHTGNVTHADGSIATAPPFVGYVPSADIPELEPQARIAQLAERCAELEKRNSYVEWLLDSKRSAPTPLQVSGPKLVVDNADVEPESELQLEPDPAA